MDILFLRAGFGDSTTAIILAPCMVWRRPPSAAGARSLQPSLLLGGPGRAAGSSGGCVCPKLSCVDTKRRQEGVALAAPKPGAFTNSRERRVEGGRSRDAWCAVDAYRRGVRALVLSDAAGARRRCRGPGEPSSPRCGRARARVDLLQAFLELRGVQERPAGTCWRFAPPGHFYSPIPSESDIAAARATWRTDADVDSGRRPRTRPVSWRCWSSSPRLYPSVPFTDEGRPGYRYRYVNPSDACTRRHLPARDAAPRPAATGSLEIGSGYSSAVTLDTSEHFLGGSLAVRVRRAVSGAAPRADDARRTTSASESDPRNGCRTSRSSSSTSWPPMTSCLSIRRTSPRR